MQLTEIEYFLAIASALNLNHAAKSLYISPSALSQFLTKLERRLGVTLFVRNKDSLQLTAAGEVYYNAAKQISGIKVNTLEQLERMNAPDSSAITLSAIGYRAITFLSRIWPTLKEEIPEQTFHAYNNNVGVVYAQVVDGSTDFGVGALNYTRQKDFQFFLLRHDEIGLLLPKEHPVNLQLREQGVSPDTPVDISVCQGHGFLLTESNVVFTNTCRRYLRRENFTPARVSISMQRSTALVAEMNNLIAMTSAGHHSPDSNLVFQRLKDPMHYDLGLFCLRHRELSPTDRQLISLIQKHKDLY